MACLAVHVPLVWNSSADFLCCDSQLQIFANVVVFIHVMGCIYCFENLLRLEP